MDSQSLAGDPAGRDWMPGPDVTQKIQAEKKPK
jgi:hypothetical protein